MCDMIGAKVIAHERSRTDGSTSTGDDLRGLDVSSFSTSAADLLGASHFTFLHTNTKLVMAKRVIRESKVSQGPPETKSLQKYQKNKNV